MTLTPTPTPNNMTAKSLPPVVMPIIPTAQVIISDNSKIPSMTSTLTPTPTPTPDDIAAKSLPTVVVPVIPTIQVIEAVPDYDFGATYEIAVRRANTGELVIIKVPLGIESDKIIEEFVNEGDEVLHVIMPLGGPPPRPTDNQVD